MSLDMILLICVIWLVFSFINSLFYANGIIEILLGPIWIIYAVVSDIFRGLK